MGVVLHLKAHTPRAFLSELIAIDIIEYQPTVILQREALRLAQVGSSSMAVTGLTSTRLPESPGQLWCPDRAYLPVVHHAEGHKAPSFWRVAGECPGLHPGHVLQANGA